MASARPPSSPTPCPPSHSDISSYHWRSGGGEGEGWGLKGYRGGWVGWAEKWGGPRDPKKRCGMLNSASVSRGGSCPPCPTHPPSTLPFAVSTTACMVPIAHRDGWVGGGRGLALVEVVFGEVSKLRELGSPPPPHTAPALILPITTPSCICPCCGRAWWVTPGCKVEQGMGRCGGGGVACKNRARYLTVSPYI